MTHNGGTPKCVGGPGKESECKIPDDDSGGIGAGGVILIIILILGCGCGAAVFFGFLHVDLANMSVSTRAGSMGGTKAEPLLDSGDQYRALS